ncbi:TonB-dependent receptor [Aquidulcibacter sp.]|uniref:TonB-dependent receptor n=1 Tax=Aquidulcibacter sp. TaxID=2052990 RepID=UPI0025BAE1F0|nr:TonB-dependent receptor [Aquidulcibacter sp.]MCA3691920.1 TonB-dependent receptor [Aquidulcibacter sp.]
MYSGAKFGNRSRLNSRLSIALLSGTAAIASPVFAQNATRPATPPVAQDAAPAKEVEQIVVVGIRRSLQSALGEKRNADSLIEVIKAEDIGKLPDQNLAEVLENVTGIQITRSAGVGSAVQIRGTDANRTEINGVSTVSSGASRSGISFEDLPAALIASVEVTKVPTAQTIEGSVGGTINLRTIRPLSLKEPLISARVQSETSDLSKSTLPRVSATLGRRWDTNIGEIGLVISGSHARQDVASFSPRVDRDAIVLPGSGPSAQSFPFLRIQFFDQELINYEYDTKNYTGAFEWKPNDRLKFYFDATLNDQQRTQESTRVQISGTASGTVVNATNNTSFETVNWGSLDGPNGPINLGTVQAALTGTIGVGVETNGTIDPNLRTSSNTGARLTESRVFAFGSEWEPTDRLKVRAEGSISTSKSDFPNFSTTLDFINPLGPQPSFGRSIDNGVPTEFDLRGGILQFGLNAASPISPTSAMMLNPANYRLQQVTQGANKTDNEEKAARFDLSYDASDRIKYVKSVDFGYRWNRNTAINNVFTNNVTLTNPTTHWNRPSGDRFASILVPGPSNFNDADGRRLYFPNFLIIDGALSFSNPTQVLDALNTAITAANAARTVGGAIAPLTVPTESASGFFTINETTNAAYLQANFETEIAGKSVTGNAGVRYLDTKISSIGNNVSNNTSGGQIVADSSYSFWLPRLNVVTEAADRFFIRAGIARDIRRPDFDRMSTSVSFGTSPNTPVPVGNPDLVPEAVWSYDLSAEWYFAPSSLISVGFFHKSRTNLFAQRQEDPAPNLVGSQLNIDITPPCEGGGIYNPIAQRGINNPTPGTGICVPLSSTFNVSGSTTQTGVEIAFQHDLSAYEETLGFASGFGFIGNFTYQKTGGSAKEYRAADGPRNVFTLLGFPNSKDRITLTNLSNYAYNATVFYDKYGLNARVRYTWRSSYATDDSFFFGLPRINGDRGQLNASINYDITDNINIGIEGINLLRSDQRQYCVNNNALLCFQGLTDRRLTAGLNVKF